MTDRSLLCAMATAVQFSAVSYGETPMARKKECPRRDSLSSSRTGDSGYVSDVEAGLSPLEVWGAWQGRWTLGGYIYM